jgi:hypothetical protein
MLNKNHLEQNYLCIFGVEHGFSDHNNNSKYNLNNRGCTCKMNQPIQTSKHVRKQNVDNGDNVYKINNYPFI